MATTKPFAGWTLEMLRRHRKNLVDGIDWAIWNENSGYEVEFSSKTLRQQLRDLDERVAELVAEETGERA